MLHEQIKTFEQIDKELHIRPQKKKEKEEANTAELKFD